MMKSAEEESQLNQTKQTELYELVRRRNQQAIEELRAEHRNRHSELYERFTNHVLDEVMLPEQASFIRGLVEREKKINRSNYGDVFGFLAASVRESEMPANDKSKLVTMIETERTAFHRELKTMRLELFQQVLDSMNPRDVEKLQEMVGDPYDYPSEMIAKWDRLRQRNGEGK